MTNKLTFDPPTRLPEMTQNVIRSSHGHSTPSLKISCKSVQPFSRNVADKKKQTKKERKKQPNKQTNKSLENNSPSPYRVRGKIITLDNHEDYRHDSSSVMAVRWARVLPPNESHRGQSQFFAITTTIYSVGHGLHTLTAMPR